jgi:hypothetical protein
MTYVLIALVIVVVLISVLALGAFRPARVTSRREIVGRPRRRLGAILLATGLLGLVGGQVYAVSVGPGRIAEGEEGEVLLPAPKPGGGDPDRYLVRVLTLSDLDPERPRVLEYGWAVTPVGREVEVEMQGTGSITTGEYGLRITGLAGGQHSVSYHARISDGSGMTSMSSSRQLGRDGTLTDTLDLGGRDVAAAATAVFPRTVFPGAVLPHTVVLVDPAPAGVEDVPFGDLLVGPEGARIRAACGDPANGGVRSVRRGTRGIARIFGSLSIWAWILLAATGTGAAFLTARSGVGLGLFLLVAPVLLTGLDGIAVARMRAALDHEDARVRASAMAGLQGSVLFGKSGPEAVSEAADRDPEVAERIRRLLPDLSHVKRERIWIGGTEPHPPGD